MEAAQREADDARVAGVLLLCAVFVPWRRCSAERTTRAGAARSGSAPPRAGSHIERAYDEPNDKVQSQSDGPARSRNGKRGSLSIKSLPVAVVRS